MTLHISDPDTDLLVRHYAAMKGVSPTEAVRLAVDAAMQQATVAERIRPIQDRVKAAGRTGLKADKAFYDSLNDE